MSKELSRRKLIAGAGAGLAITAFDPIGRTWISSAQARSQRDQCQQEIQLPRLDGELTSESDALDEAASDFGGIVSKTPRAVLRPGSEKDISTLIKFCNKHRIQVAMRGQGHAVFGEAQVDCGVVIDSRSLDTIHSISEEGAVVDAGVKWSTLTLAALDQGLTPLVLTDYLELSVGGVLSVGGIGGNMNQVGSVADNVNEFRFVTGEGRRKVCSRRRNRDLYRSALGSLGQLGVITGATIALGPAPELARIYELTYSNLSQYLIDQRTLVRDARFDYQEGQIVPAAGGGWAYKIEVGVYYNSSASPDDGALLNGLSPDSGMVTTDFPYFVWLNRVSFAEASLRDLGLWDTPNPWSDLFVPDSNVEEYIQNDVIPFLTPDQVGAGLVLLYPFRRKQVRQRFFSLPRDPVVWAFDILRFPFDPTSTDSLLAENRRLFDRATEAGGKQYPIGALELSPDDWVSHYGRSFYSFLHRKWRYDRRNIMTPGQGIFGKVF